MRLLVVASLDTEAITGMLPIGLAWRGIRLARRPSPGRRIPGDGGPQFVALIGTCTIAAAIAADATQQEWPHVAIGW